MDCEPPFYGLGKIFWISDLSYHRQVTSNSMARILLQNFSVHPAAKFLRSATHAPQKFAANTKTNPSPNPNSAEVLNPKSVRNPNPNLSILACQL